MAGRQRGRRDNGGGIIDGDAAGEIDDIKIALERLAVIIGHRHSSTDDDGIANLHGELRGGRPQFVAPGIDAHIGVARSIHGFDDFSGKAGGFRRCCGGSRCVLGGNELSGGKQPGEEDEVFQVFHKSF